MLLEPNLVRAADARDEAELDDLLERLSAPNFARSQMLSNTRLQ